MISLFKVQTHIILLVIITLFFNSLEINAQISNSEKVNDTSNPLAGLKLAGPGDIDSGTPMMLDPMSMPMYDEQLQKINPADFMKIMMSNEYIPEPYVDEKKVVKAFVLRKATDDEKAMMSKMQQGRMGSEQEESPLVGTQAVDFDVTDLKGKKYKLSELKGKIVALNFWFVECKPCIMEMPELNELVEEFKGKEVVFLAIAVNNQKQLKKFLKTTDFNYKVISSGQFVSDSYRIKGFPTNIIIDQNGLIQYASTGIGPNNKANLLKQINKLLIK
jgi:peroxiredoxin